MRYVLIVFIFSISFFTISGYSQNGIDQVVFVNQPVNYEGTTGADTTVISLQKGRLVYKKVEVPNFPNGTDVKINLSLRSEGDRWDKTGSCFVVADPKLISILDIAEGNKKFPTESGIDGGISWREKNK